MTWDVPQLMTADEVAEVLRVKPAVVTRLRRQGALPGVRVGRTYRYTQAAVAAYIDRQGQPPTPTEQ